jgi:hypothetical protein
LAQLVEAEVKQEEKREIKLQNQLKKDEEEKNAIFDNIMDDKVVIVAIERMIYES